MKYKLSTFFLLLPLILSGCTTSQASNGSNSSNGGNTSQNTTGTTSGDTTSGDNTTSEDVTSDDTTQPEGEDETIDLGVKTIAQIKELCLEHVKDSDLNEGGLGFSTQYTVTLKAWAIDHFDLSKAKAPYGILPREKTIFADETGYIAVSGTALFNKAKNYTDKRKSYYEMTGKLSRYMTIPELYVKDTYQYVSNKDLTESFDAFPLAKDTLSVSQLYTKFVNAQYNCAGYGYDDVYQVNNLKVVEKSDSDQYMVTDGYKMLKMISYDNLQAGSYYNIVGMLSTVNWQPAIRSLSYQTVTDQSIINNFPSDYLTPIVTTVAQLKTIKASQDDTTARFDNFINSFQSVYKITGYINYYVIDGSKYHLTLSDNRYTGSELVSQITAHNEKGMIEFENPNYSNSWDKIQNSTYVDPYISQAIGLNEEVEIYFMPWQCNYSSKKPIWKIFHLTETIPV